MRLAEQAETRTTVGDRGETGSRPASGCEDALRTAMEQQYARRTANDWTYSSLAPHYIPVRQDIERNLHACLRLFCKQRGVSRADWKAELEPMRVLDVGCGSGAWLSFLITLGFRPENLRGVEILEERANRSRENLPAATEIAYESFAGYREGDFDLILFSVVFSSILRSEQRIEMARTAVKKLRVDGAIIVFDFVYDNPKNPDVKRVTRREIERYFLGCSILLERSALLAPPIARLACRVHPCLYHLLNVPILRSHRFWMIAKDQRSSTVAARTPLAVAPATSPSP